MPTFIATITHTSTFNIFICQTSKTDVIVFISNVILCLMSHWLIIVQYHGQSIDTENIARWDQKKNAWITNNTSSSTSHRQLYTEKRPPKIIWFLAILFRPFGLLAPKTFKIICLSSLSTLSTPDGYSRNVLCTLNFVISMFLLQYI